MTYNVVRKISQSAGRIFSQVDSPKEDRKARGSKVLCTHLTDNKVWQHFWVICLNGNGNLEVAYHLMKENWGQQVCVLMFRRCFTLEEATLVSTLQGNRTLHGIVLYCKRHLVLRLFVRWLETSLGGNKLFCSMIRFVFACHYCCFA